MAGEQFPEMSHLKIPIELIESSTAVSIDDDIFVMPTELDGFTSNTVDPTYLDSLIHMMPKVDQLRVIDELARRVDA